jgi:tetratricopeptide (TPR) repeat protein
MGQSALSESLRAVEAEIAAGHPDRALVLCQDVQTRYPRALPVQRVLGEVYLALRKPREALGALDRALAGNPEDARACCARALVHQIHGDSLAALAWYRRACDISPDDQVLRSAYHEMAAHLHQPSYQPTRMGLARLYLRGDLFPHAIREWQALLADQPDSLEAQVGLAETLWRARRTQEAAERSRRILGNAPSCVKALLFLAATEYDAGRADEARALLRRVAELDPEQKLAQALFADRLAAGDSAFARVMFGDEGASAQQRARSTGALSGVLDARVAGSAGGSRPASRPLNPPSAPAPAPAPAVQPYPTGGPIPDGIAASAGRPSALPPDFRTIFAETEYMLWSRDEDAASTGKVPAFERSRVDPFARSTSFVPPVLREQGSSLEDTEARAAINWIHWLQAQGARARESLSGRPGTGPLPDAFAPPSPPTVQPTPSPSGRLTQVPPPMPPAPPAESEQEWAAHQTEPLAPPSSEALRAMFAELGPEATSRRVVEGELVSAVDTNTVDADVVEAEAAAPLRPSDASPAQPVEATPAPESAQSWTDAQAATSWPTQTPLPGDEEPPDEAEAAGDADDAGVREAEVPVLTLESLERSFADSGFSSYELKPGELAVLSSDSVAGNGWHVTDAPQPALSPETTGQSDTPAYEPEPDDAVASVAEDMAAFVTEPEPEPDAEPRPAADDYPGRLELARRRRGDGRLDEALNDYRVVLKNAPDLLNDVVSELQESLSAAPDHPEIHRLLGDARIRQGDYLSALESYNRAVALTQTETQGS